MTRIIRWSPLSRQAAPWGLLLLPALFLSHACDDGTSPEMAQIQVQLTDAPADAIASAQVWISRIYLQGCDEVEGEEEETCEAVDLYNDSENSQEFDLMTLQDGVTAELTDLVTVEAKVYRQLRLVVDSAKVTLAEGYTFANAEEPFNEMTLSVPSGSTSGIKVHLTEAINSETEEVTIIVVDFDVADNFHLQGAGQENVIDGVTFTPTLKEKGRSHGAG